jgi:hypothetical protein
MNIFIIKSQNMTIFITTIVRFPTMQAGIGGLKLGSLCFKNGKRKCDKKGWTRTVLVLDND